MSICGVATVYPLPLGVSTLTSPTLSLSQDGAGAITPVGGLAYQSNNVWNWRATAADNTFTNALLVVTDAKLPVAMCFLLTNELDVWNTMLTNMTLSGSVGAGVAALLTAYTTARGGYLDLLNTNLNATVSSRLAATSYTAPDNTDAAAVSAVGDAVSTLQSDITNINLSSALTAYGAATTSDVTGAESTLAGLLAAGVTLSSAQVVTLTNTLVAAVQSSGVTLSSEQISTIAIAIALAVGTRPTLMVSLPISAPGGTIPLTCGDTYDTPGTGPITLGGLTCTQSLSGASFAMEFLTGETVNLSVPATISPTPPASGPYTFTAPLASDQTASLPSSANKYSLQARWPQVLPLKRPLFPVSMAVQQPGATAPAYPANVLTSTLEIGVNAWNSFFAYAENMYVTYGGQTYQAQQLTAAAAGNTVDGTKYWVYAANPLYTNAWSSAANYTRGQFVTDSGVIYVCLTDVAANVTHPAADSTHWLAVTEPPPSGVYAFVPGTTYAAGSYATYLGNLVLAIRDTAPTPGADTNYWQVADVLPATPPYVVGESFTLSDGLITGTFQVQRVPSTQLPNYEVCCTAFSFWDNKPYVPVLPHAWGQTASTPGTAGNVLNSWVSGKAYQAGNCVSSAGSAYVCTVNVTSSTAPASDLLTPSTPHGHWAPIPTAAIVTPWVSGTPHALGLFATYGSLQGAGAVATYGGTSNLFVCVAAESDTRLAPAGNATWVNVTVP